MTIRERVMSAQEIAEGVFLDSQAYGNPLDRADLFKTAAESWDAGFIAAEDYYHEELEKAAATESSTTVDNSEALKALEELLQDALWKNATQMTDDQIAAHGTLIRRALSNVSAPATTVTEDDDLISRGF
jgi:hypothetical protein